MVYFETIKFEEVQYFFTKIQIVPSPLLQETFPHGNVMVMVYIPHMHITQSPGDFHFYYRVRSDVSL